VDGNIATNTDLTIELKGVTGVILSDMIADGNIVLDLQGTNGNDRIDGGARNDDIYGNGGNDILRGGAGNDKIYGGAGNDTLVGGAGKDTFKYDSPNDGADAIFDFQVGDTNILSATYDADADVIDLARLLNYNQGDDINDFITLIDNGIAGTTTLNINADGIGTDTDVTIHLTVTGVSLTEMINDGNIVLF
jgi:Ca2+-binding RTX toxin-like protein